MIKVKGKIYQFDDCVTFKKWSKNHSKDNNETTKVMTLWGCEADTQLKNHSETNYKTDKK